jgi:hypothetical protein
MTGTGRASVWICEAINCGFIGMYKPEIDAKRTQRTCPECGSTGYHRTGDIALVAVETR